MAAACVQQFLPFGGSSVMVRGGICGDQKTYFVIICQTLPVQGYRDQVLQPVVDPFMQRQRQELILQQDNARPHRARHTMNFLNGQNVQLLPGHYAPLTCHRASVGLSRQTAMTSCTATSNHSTAGTGTAEGVTANP